MTGAMLHWVETSTGPRPPCVPGIELAYRRPTLVGRRDLVDMFGYRERAAHQFRQTQAARLTVPWILSFGDPFRVATGDSARVGVVRGSVIAGLHAKPIIVDSSGSSACITVNFTPHGARRFLGVPMYEIVDDMVAIDSLPAAAEAELLERIAGESCWERRFDLVEHFIANRIGGEETRPSVAEIAFDRLLRFSGGERIGTVAADLGWSKKHLAARFRDEIGLTPKTVAQIARFHRALSHARRDRNDWAGIAHDCGYADQSHLVRDFTRFVGESPTRWRARLIR